LFYPYLEGGPTEPAADVRLVDLAKFDLNLLRVLDALLHERNVTRTAANLHVTQQAVSNSLRRLREHFHDPLLVRVGRKMEPSSLAQALEQPLRDALIHLETVVRLQAEFDPATTIRSFRQSMPHYATFLFLPQVLRRLAAEAPRITLETGVTGADSMAALERRDLDLLVMDQSASGSQIALSGERMRRQFLSSDDFVCVADKDHPDLKSELTRELYMRLPHCVTRFAGESRSLVERSWSKLGRQPRVGAIAPGFVVTLFTLPHTGLIGTVPRKLAALHADSLGLRIHKCPIKVEPIDEYLFWHPINDDDPAHSYIRSLFRSASSNETVRSPRRSVGRALLERHRIPR
jgi:LysR family transcriptional regulator, nod-box dependent transcriptional activator